MFRILIIGNGSERLKKLGTVLAGRGFLCTMASAGDHVTLCSGVPPADLVVVAINGVPAGSEAGILPQRLKERMRLPVIALLSSGSLDVLNSAPDVDDFVMEPWNEHEVVARVRRVMHRKPDADSKNLIRCGDLTIDMAKCKVAYRGRLVDLTFKEYELLKFLVSNKGRVFSRETLLNSVWGYDYYGGDRTVDVHVRRLRSKLDDSGCIETVRNIGYRFRDDS